MTTTHAAHPLANVDAPYGAILRLATPTVVAMLSQSIVNEVDVVFFSRLPCPESSNGQAALLPALIVVWLFGGSLSAISVGTQALTARRYAERKPHDAGAVLANSAFFCLLAGGLFSLVGYLLLPALFGMMIKVPAVRNVALAYTRWRMLGVTSMAMTMAIKAFFDGIGRTHVHLVAAVVMNVINVALCWLFIFGTFGAPRMGAVGAGMSAFIATWIGLLIMLVYAWLVRAEFRPFRVANLSRRLMWDLLRLSIPAGIATIVMMFGFGLFSAVVGRLDEGLAAHVASIGTVAGACGAAEAVNSAATTDIVEILKLTFTACLAFGTAAATLVGQSLGARRPEDATRFGWATVRLGLMIFGVVGLCEGVFFTRPIIDFISRSDAVRAAALFPMHLVGIITPVIAVAMILSEALFGAGNTKFVAVAQFVLVFGCLLPLALVLGLVMHMALVGIWVAACVYFVFAAITMTLKFRQGSWRTIVL
jgi:MATE family multidrug resistance protein